MSSTAKTKKTIEIFYSYSHKDQRFRDQLEIRLALLKREGLISEWYDRKISAGKEWANEIDNHLNAADIILLLISPDFMASDYCYDIEVKRAMERHERGEARVIPIICRPVYWRGSAFRKLEPLPTLSRPITAPSWHNQDEAFFDVAEGIRKIVEELTSSIATSPQQVKSKCLQHQIPLYTNLPEPILIQSLPRVLLMFKEVPLKQLKNLKVQKGNVS